MWLPELPEVETIKRTLAAIQGQYIEEYWLYTPSALKRQDFLLSEIKGHQIEDVRRRGKFLILDLGKDRLLVVHLGMSGRFYRSVPKSPNEKHLHFKLLLTSGEEIRYVDPRRFGGIRLIADENDFFRNLGPEPWDDDAPLKLAQKIKRKRSPIKSMLLDQSVIAGIGNIYADEILFRAGIDPRRSGMELTDEELVKLGQEMRLVLEDGIAKRGTTFRDYRDGNGQRGEFAASLAVYGRQGEPCYRCRTPIECVRIGGRSTHYCPQCQH